MDKILILGAQGLTGRHFVNFLKEHNIKSKCYLVDRLPEIPIYQDNYYKVNLLNRSEISGFLKNFRPDLIFSFIGLLFSHDLSKLVKINVITAENLLGSIHEIKNYQPKVLLIGSAAEYGNVKNSELPIKETCQKRPVTNYGLSKVFLDRLAEKYILSSKMKIYRAKTFNLICTGQSEKLIIGSIASQLRKIKKGLQPPKLHVGNLETQRDFIDIRDAVSAYWKIINSEYSGEVFNVGRGIPFKMGKVVDDFIKFSGLKISIIKEKEFMKKSDPPCIYADISKIRHLLKWKPQIPLEQSIKDILNIELGLSSNVKKSCLFT